MQEVLFCKAACYTVILNSVICGLIRWFHMCKPYNLNPSYFYPSRTFVTVSFLGVALLSPYLFNFDSHDTWLFTKSFLLFFFPMFGTVAFRSFFFGVTPRWMRNYINLLLIPAAIFVGLFVLACIGGNTLDTYGVWAEVVVLLASLTLAIKMLSTTHWLFSKMNEFVRGEYSNEDDFPLVFAKIVIFIPFVAWLLSLVVFFVDSHIVNACYFLVMTVLGLSITIMILHPQRKECDVMTKDIEKEAMEAKAATCRNHPIPTAVKDNIERQIRDIVEDESLYLDPKFNKTLLAERLGTNRTYLSVVFRERFGSFYSYVNTLRILYAMSYLEQHPKATQTEVAAKSGFGTTKTYAKVKKLYEAGELR
ncbi:MAG: helix-turn-helix domain-containing protein [Prevotella sp.]